VPSVYLEIWFLGKDLVPAIQKPEVLVFIRALTLSILHRKEIIFPPVTSLFLCRHTSASTSKLQHESESTYPNLLLTSPASWQLSKRRGRRRPKESPMISRRERRNDISAARRFTARGRRRHRSM
jgi:hypothetical protein